MKFGLNCLLVEGGYLSVLEGYLSVQRAYLGGWARNITLMIVMLDFKLVLLDVGIEKSQKNCTNDHFMTPAVEQLVKRGFPEIAILQCGGGVVAL